MHVHRNFRPFWPGTSRGRNFRPVVRNFRLESEYFHPFLLAAIFLWPPGHECSSMLSCLYIHLLAGGSSHRRHKRAASRTPRPHSAEIESDSDQETLASRRSQIDE